MRNVFCIWGSYCHVLHPSTHKVSARSAHLELKSGSFFLRYIIALGDKKQSCNFFLHHEKFYFHNIECSPFEKTAESFAFSPPQTKCHIDRIYLMYLKAGSKHTIWLKKIAPLSFWKKNSNFFRYFKSHRDIKPDRYSTSRKRADRCR